MRGLKRQTIIVEKANSFVGAYLKRTQNDRYCFAIVNGKTADGFA